MRVAVCVADGLMAHALGDVEHREAHIDKQAHVAVAKVVNAYPRGGRCLATAVHLVREVLYCRVLRCTTQ